MFYIGCPMWGYKEWVRVYAFCHCPFEEHSPGICAELYKRVADLVPLPPLPEQTGTEPEQARLF